MGLRKVRDDERAFIDACLQRDAVRTILANGRGGREASRYIASAYAQDDVLKNPLRGETDEEFAARRKQLKGAKRLVEETEEDYGDRMKNIERVRELMSVYIRTTDGAPESLSAHEG